MNDQEREDLKNKIDRDSDDEVSDKERRDVYFGEIEDHEDRERWEREQ